MIFSCWRRLSLSSFFLFALSFPILSRELNPICCLLGNPTSILSRGFSEMKSLSLRQWKWIRFSCFSRILVFIFINENTLSLNGNYFIVFCQDSFAEARLYSTCLESTIISHKSNDRRSITILQKFTINSWIYD